MSHYAIVATAALIAGVVIGRVWGKRKNLEGMLDLMRIMADQARANAIDPVTIPGEDGPKKGYIMYTTRRRLLAAGFPEEELNAYGIIKKGDPT